MNAQLERLREEKASTWTRMCEITDTAEREGRDLSAEERTNWDAAEARLAEITKDEERYERQSVLDAELRAGRPDPNLNPVPGQRGGEPDEARVSQAFTNWMKRGIERLGAEDRAIMQSRFDTEIESRAEGIASGSAGGYLVPQGFWQNLVVAMKAYGGIERHAQIIETASGNPMPWPSSDDTGNVGAILGENTQVSQQDIAFTQKTLNAYTYTSKLVLVSLQLIQDSAFDTDTFVNGRLAERLGRATAQHFATGTGSSQPQGLVNGLVAANSGSQVMTVATGNTTSFTADQLIDLVHTVDPAYRNERSRWILSDAAIKVIRKLKDSQNRYLWQPDYLAGGDRDAILGYPYTVDQGIAVPAANAYSVVFGDIYSAYVIRRALGLTLLRLTERYADYLQVGFLGFLRTDALVNDYRAAAVLQNSAT